MQTTGFDQRYEVKDQHFSLFAWWVYAVVEREQSTSQEKLSKMSCCGDGLVA